MKTLVFGHRGVPDLYPENSLQGFRYALYHHIDGLEFDVHLTKDNIPVVIHDERIDRTTDGRGLVNSYTYEELSQFSLENYERIPKLEELLALIEGRDVLVNLEFKTDKIHYPNIEKIVVDMVSKFELLHPVIYSSFNLSSVKIVQQLVDDAQFAYLTDRRVDNPKEFLLTNHLDALHLQFFQPDIENKERVWTVNGSLRLRFLIKHGVAAVITNNFERAMKIRQSVANKKVNKKR
ncbi:MAG: glycerophosphodiester phosphodiesterase [Apilactobacillus sp.]|uniref:glycerophosphodiester phosphodiesterase family protein n=1 Tax=Apilactobacillus TaxID=2767877 RepID=UPI0025D9AF19|nr:glycerophosphodiester phosphodiesterase family protein [Apilactobacillus sp.]MCT6823023.1 glycerophosphodiester phosphodiesterase [Apilactobacillus sp.]MCT6858454.1 glycerophosphodiester phosphodiesterase [Apilactobacillus sp.]